MMKRVRINQGTIGLVFQNGDYKRVIYPGAYWLWPSEEVIVYDLTKQFVAPKDLSIFLQDAELADKLTVVEVQDSEIVLQYENGIFTRVLTPGRYAFWKGVVDYSFIRADLRKVEITEDIDVNTLRKTALMAYIRVAKVESYEKAILFINGKKDRVLDTGSYYFWNNAIPVEFLKADMRQLQMEISGQEMLTKDKAALRVNFYTQYKVVDIEKALMNTKDYEKQLYILVQLALREFIGTLTLDEMLEKKEAVAEYVASVLKEKATKLGVEVIDSGIRDVILPGEMKDIMNKVLIAEKQAQANIITRREETASTRSLLNTAKLMEDNAMLFKLKEMEYVEKIADKISNISLNGGGQIVDQLRDIFSPGK